MSVRVDSAKSFVYPVKAQSLKENETDKKDFSSSKALQVSLAILGAVGVAALVIKHKKKPSGISQVEKIVGKNPKTETLTDIEKQKLIKELQSKTDNPDVKAEIRKLVENGEWDKL